jgi:hypothetical protein
VLVGNEVQATIVIQTLSTYITENSPENTIMTYHPQLVGGRSLSIRSTLLSSVFSANLPAGLVFPLYGIVLQVL